MRASSAVSASLIVAALLAPTGCTPRGPQPGAQPDSFSIESTPSPGLVRSDDQQVTAVGTLVYERKRKRFLLVNASPNRPLTGKESAVAAIAEGTQGNVDLVGLVGAYVEVSGVTVESTLTVIPELGIESIRIIALPEERPATPGALEGTSSP